MIIQEHQKEINICKMRVFYKKEALQRSKNTSYGNHQGKSKFLQIIHICFLTENLIHQNKRGIQPNPIILQDQIQLKATLQKRAARIFLKLCLLNLLKIKQSSLSIQSFQKLKLKVDRLNHQYRLRDLQNLFQSCPAQIRVKALVMTKIPVVNQMRKAINDKKQKRK